jgi:putative DNA primase/helicase
VVTSGIAPLPVLDKTHMLACARQFRDSTAGHETLRYHNGNWYALVPPHTAYIELEAASVRAALYLFLENSVVRRGNGDNLEYEPFKPHVADVNAILDALRAVSHLPATAQGPCWLPTATHPRASQWDPHDMIAVENGLLHLPTRELIPATPDFFTTTQLPYPYDPDAPPPTRWLRFVASAWPNDRPSVDQLQEIIGYLLSGDTGQQKVFLFKGLPRSGKGTTARLVRGLIGADNVCAPSFSNLGETFGLQQFIDKSVAIIPDGRLGSRSNATQVLERLLSISGEDTITVPRKHKADWIGTLRARVVVMSNELPRIRDISGAFASRFVILSFGQSFLGREDLGLTKALRKELSSILNWALDGRDRIISQGQFTLPAASREALDQMAELSSPVLSFVEDRCEVFEGTMESQDCLFDAWKQWCRAHGRRRPGTSQVFARDLTTVVPGLKRVRPRVRGRQVRHWEGIRLVPVPAEDALQADGLTTVLSRDESQDEGAENG